MSAQGGREPYDAARSSPPLRALLVTGMSGAGRSTALKILEDLGYESFDNMPAALIPALVETAAADGSPIAVGADTRTRGFAAATVLEILADAALRSGRERCVLFIDCDDDRLERRYTETRRPHPLAGDRPILDGIRRERQIVAPLRARADLLIDTSALTANDLKRVLTGHFALEPGGLRVFVTSFAYRHGLPRDADLVFDARFLENPHYIDALRGQSGRDPAVGAHIETDPDFPIFFDRLWQLLGPLLPRYETSGKTYLTIAIGCTGGRHRSVYVAERLARRLREAGWRTGLAHRDLPAAEAGAPIALGMRAAALSARPSSRGNR
jgi:RNase adapter protein RapZ